MYQPPFTISGEMLLLVSSISEKIGRISERRAEEAKPHLRRDNRIRSIHSSLAIEANSLSLEEVRAVIDGKAVVGTAGEILEVQNAYRAYEEIPKIDPYSEEDLLRVHGILTGGMIRESGQYRHGNEGVFSGGECIFAAPPPKIVPTLMHDLFSWMFVSREKVHPLILSSIFHYEFVFIHPFSDGNGRMARLWQTALLSEWNEQFLYMPIESQIQKFQQGYYDAIADCNRNGRPDEFIVFMLMRIDEAIESMLGEARTSINDEEGRIARLIRQMLPGQSYSAAELLSLLGLKSRKTFRANYLQPAMRQGRIRMTDPEHPRSSRQK